jgi:hypothetical protein
VDESADGAVVRVRVRPRSRPGVEWRGDELVISVAAPAVEGRATEEARRSLADALGVSPGRVSIHSGGRSRTKAFLVEGLDQQEVRSRLRRAGGPPR